AISFADALWLVRRRGELMGSAGAQRPGAMTAILGLSDADVEDACAAAAEGQVVVAGNRNAPGQVVISGDADAVARAGEEARARGARRVVPLQVSGAFHSPLMAPAAEGLREALRETEIRDTRLPVVANVTGEPVTRAEEIRRLLVEQLTSPVLWHACVLGLVALGCTDVLECGPGRVLTGMAKRVPGVGWSGAFGDTAELPRRNGDDAWA
ncbi:MAG: ACP S-malonyltransferase, partial [Gemmatimonadetes bacterium]|nr:ACP S-malonyltransferase [Gemmatimonadota bacterium]